MDDETDETDETEATRAAMQRQPAWPIHHCLHEAAAADGYAAILKVWHMLKSTTIVQSWLLKVRKMASH